MNVGCDRFTVCIFALMMIVPQVHPALPLDRSVTTLGPVTRLYNGTRYEVSLWISDWLDNGNNKKALQEADKVLKKHPTNQCARVLKALALLRMGKENECQVIMDKVRSEVPCEDSTLQAMSICYREIHQRKFLAHLLISNIKIVFKFNYMTIMSILNLRMQQTKSASFTKPLLRLIQTTKSS